MKRIASPAHSFMIDFPGGRGIVSINDRMEIVLFGHPYLETIGCTNWNEMEAYCRTKGWPINDVIYDYGKVKS